MVRRTLEIKGSALPESIRGKDIEAGDLVRITIETLNPAIETSRPEADKPEADKKMQVREFIEAADRYEGTRGNGLDVSSFVRSLRDEWDQN